MIKLKDLYPQMASFQQEEYKKATESLDPMKDFAKKGENKKYNLNLGAFVGAYQDFVKFIKKHKEVPDGNKKEWALKIRDDVGQAKFNGFIGLFTQPVEVLTKYKKYEKSKNVQFTEGKRIVESNIKVIPSKKIDSKTWRNMKYDLRDQIDELVKIGEDYKVFASAQVTHRMLKQIKRLMDKI